MGATDELIQASKKATQEHIAQVVVFIERMREVLEQRKGQHDVSKMQEPELSAYAVTVPKLAGLDYGTPEHRAVLRQMKPAIKHHYAANRHHPEFHDDGVDGMNLIDVLEMICDWKAAAIRSGSPEKFRENVEKSIERFNISPQMGSVIRNTLDLLES